MAGRVRGNKKPTEMTEEMLKKRLQSLREAYFEYLEVSKMLFADKNPIYDINELKEDNKFYLPAKTIAEQLEVSWDDMSHEDSNRIMLALLEDYYKRMAEVVNTKGITIQVNFKLDYEQRQKK